MDAVTLAAANAAAAKRYPPNRPRTVVLLGDSITYNGGPNGPDATHPYFNNSAGWWHWAMQELGQPLRLLNQAGITGQTSTQILARFAADVAAYAPGYVVIEMGTNNADTGTAQQQAAALEADFLTAFQLCRQIGAQPIVPTILPNNGHSATKRAAMDIVNGWLKRQLRAPVGRNSAPVIVDWSAALTDGNGNMNTAAGATTQVSADGTHPVTLGARRMGRALATALRPYLPTIDHFAGNPLDAGNPLVNPRMDGAGGNNSGGTGSGQVASSWTIVATGTPTWVASKVARTDIPNLFWQQIAMSSQGSGGGVALLQNITTMTTINPGDGSWWYAEAEFQTDPWTSATQGMFLDMQWSGGASSGRTRDFNQNGDTAGAVQYPLENQLTSGVMRTPPVQFSTGTTLVQPSFNLYAVGTARVGRIHIRKLLDYAS